MSETTVVVNQFTPYVNISAEQNSKGWNKKIEVKHAPNGDIAEEMFKDAHARLNKLIGIAQEAAATSVTD